MNDKEDKKKLSKGKKVIIIVVAIIASFILAIELSSTTHENNISSSKPTTQENIHTYDSLQKVFLEITDSTTKERVKGYIKKYNLKYTDNKYTGDKVTYRLAYTEDSALQRYAESGDHIDITFDSSNKIEYAEYCPEGHSCTAVYYNFGTFWDFNYEKPGEASGYYYHTFTGDEDGVVLHYDNGVEIRTRYYKCANAKEALNQVLERG